MSMMDYALSWSNHPYFPKMVIVRIVVSRILDGLKEQLRGLPVPFANSLTKKQPNTLFDKFSRLFTCEEFMTHKFTSTAESGDDKFA